MRIVLGGAFAGSVLVAFACSACGESKSASPKTTDDVASTDDTGGKKTTNSDDDDDAATDAPVVGYVRLNENTIFVTGNPASTQTTLYAGFSHPYKLEKQCGEKKIGECTLYPAATCSTECGAGKYCMWKKDCSGTFCIESPKGSCDAGETLQINSSDEWECTRYSDKLDAGTITLSIAGESTSFSSPDYTQSPSELGFSPSSAYSVSAAGGDVSKFKGTLSTPALLSSNLSDLTPDVLPPGKSFDLKWTKGSGLISIQMSGFDKGVLRCDLKKDSGNFAVSSDLLDEIRGENLNVSISRTNTTLAKNVTATANGKTVAGNVELIGMVYESATVRAQK